MVQMSLIPILKIVKCFLGLHEGVKIYQFTVSYKIYIEEFGYVPRIPMHPNPIYLVPVIIFYNL